MLFSDNICPFRKGTCSIRIHVNAFSGNDHDSVEVHIPNGYFRSTKIRNKRIDVECTYSIQYIHLIAAQVDRTSASAWLFKRLWIACQK